MTSLLGKLPSRLVGCLLSGVVLVSGALLAWVGWPGLTVFLCLVVLLGLALVVLAWPDAHPVKALCVFSLGCALGGALTLQALAQRESRAVHDRALDAFLLDESIRSALRTSNCPLVLELLENDLALLHRRSAWSAHPRYGVWDRAAEGGCVSGEQLEAARSFLAEHALRAPLETPFLTRAELLLALPVEPGSENP